MVLPKFARHYTNVESLMNILRSNAIWSTAKTGTIGDLGDGVYFTELFTPLEIGHGRKEIAILTKKIGHADVYDSSIYAAFIDAKLDELGKEYTIEYNPSNYPHQFCLVLPNGKDEFSLLEVPFLAGEFITS